MQGSTVRQASAVLTGTASGVGHDRFMVNSSPPLLDILSQTLAAELALPDPATATVIVARLLVAIVLGGMLGLEREAKGRAAGLRTHILVCIGSALFVMAPLLAGVSQADVTRVMQGIVSGIGFLGAGAILKLDHEERVQGLTTAAGIWAAAAIGMAVGMGMHLLALASTVAALLVVSLLPRLLPDKPAPPQ
jgi:putative Mg2+ transporter-C (MgtC) family protein